MTQTTSGLESWCNLPLSGEQGKPLYPAQTRQTSPTRTWPLHLEEILNICFNCKMDPHKPAGLCAIRLWIASSLACGLVRQMVREKHLGTAFPGISQTKGCTGDQDFIFHRPFPKAASSRVLIFCQSLSALHSQCLSPHSLAAGGVRSLGKSQAWGCFLSCQCLWLCLHPQPLPSSLSCRFALLPSNGHTPQNPDCHKCLTLPDSDPDSVF